MNKQVIYIAVALIGLFADKINAQSKAGIQMLHEERWWSAKNEFSKSTDEADIFYKGFCEMKTEEFDKAKTTFQSIATKPFGKIGLGWLELNSNNKDGANKLFEEAAKETKNKNPEIFTAISRAIANSNINGKEGAVEWAKKANEFSKNNAEYKFVLGDAYACDPNLGGDAIVNYEAAQELDKASPISYSKIGLIWYRNRNYKDALAGFRTAMEKSPNNLMALKYLARIYYDYKVYDTAKMYQDKLIEVGDKNPEDMVLLANIMFYQKDYDGLINTLSSQTGENSKYNYFNRLLGYAHQEKGNSQDAVNFLEKFLQNQPKEKVIGSDYEYLGKSYMGLGDTTKGIETIKKGLELLENDKDAQRSAADFFKKAKKNNEALEIYKKLAAAPDAAVTDHLKLGNIYFYQMKDYDNADAVYTKVLELSPNQVDVYYNKARIKLFKEPNQETSSAKADYIKYLEMTKGKEEKYKKNVVEANIYMAKDAILKLNDNAAATPYIQAIEALDPNHPELTTLKEAIK